MTALPARHRSAPRAGGVPFAREHQEQEALFQWAAWASAGHPELNLLHHNPMGSGAAFGSKTFRLALARRGGKGGVPDLFLPVARCGFHGLWIELKVGKNKPSKNQLWWLNELAGQGYKAVVCYGWESAKDEILRYLKG